MHLPSWQQGSDCCRVWPTLPYLNLHNDRQQINNAWASMPYIFDCQQHRSINAFCVAHVDCIEKGGQGIPECATFLVTRVLLCAIEDDSLMLLPTNSDSVLSSVTSKNQDSEDGTCMMVRHSWPAATACAYQGKQHKATA
jgi:hypothetical protein